MSIKLTSFIACVFVIGGMAPFVSEAAISMSGTRLIYNEDSKETPLTIHNTDDGSIFLIRSWIDNTNGKIPFTITPPLFRIDSGQENSIRVSKADTSTLSKGKETLFWLNVMAIPPQGGQKGDKLQFTLNNKIKLIFRPSSLNNKQSVQTAYTKLKFTKRTSSIRIDNPTPYYVNIFQMKIDNVLVKEKGLTIPPLGGVEIDQTAGSKVTWSAINDFGGITKETSVNI
ncbi:UNVERIFIED_ORG: P pilus assembly chaperone PapD [Buttiauxella agrestis ATCC 33320]